MPLANVTPKKMPLSTTNTAPGRVCDDFSHSRHYDRDFSRLLFLHAHREVSALANEIPEESDQFRFLRAACLANIKGSVGLIFGEDFDHEDFNTT